MSLSHEQQKSFRILAMRYFVGCRYSPEQSAGIVGNLMQESGMDPSIHQIGVSPLPDVIRSKGGYGLAQWTSISRKLGLEAFAVRNNSAINNFALQLKYLIYELNTTEKLANSYLVLTKTPEEAAQVFCSKFERPGEPMMQNRIKYALEAYREYMEAEMEEKAAIQEQLSTKSEHWLVRLIKWVRSL